MDGIGPWYLSSLWITLLIFTGFRFKLSNLDVLNHKISLTADLWGWWFYNVIVSYLSQIKRFFFSIWFNALGIVIPTFVTVLWRFTNIHLQSS